MRQVAITSITTTTRSLVRVQKFNPVFHARMSHVERGGCHDIDFSKCLVRHHHHHQQQTPIVLCHTTRTGNAIGALSCNGYRRTYMDVHTRPSHSGMLQNNALSFQSPAAQPSSLSNPPVRVHRVVPESLHRGARGQGSEGNGRGLYTLILTRAAMAAGWVYIMTEYVADITLCEGPSMHPTIRPMGEMVLVEKFTLRWTPACLKAEERIEMARKRQAAYEASIANQHELNGQHAADSVPFWHEPCLSVTDVEHELQGKSHWHFWKTVLQQWMSPLSVGDVVVVQHPTRKGTICKRVLGLPGDQVILSRPQQQQQQQHQPWQNTFDNSPPFRNRGSPSSSSSSNLLTIQDGHVWLEGDNPANSADSRQYGPVPASLIVGRVVARVWPIRGHAVLLRGSRPNSTWDSNNSNNNIRNSNDRGRDAMTLSSLWMMIMSSQLGDPNSDLNSSHTNRHGSIILPAGYEGQHIRRKPWVDVSTSENEGDKDDKDDKDNSQPLQSVIDGKQGTKANARSGV